MTLIGELEAAVSFVVPVTFHPVGHERLVCRYLLLAEVTSEALRALKCQAMLRPEAAAAVRASLCLDNDDMVPDDAVLRSEVWGETMASSDVDMGMKDLLSDLFVMPEAKKPPLAPPRTVKPRPSVIPNQTFVNPTATTAKALSPRLQQQQQVCACARL